MRGLPEHVASHLGMLTTEERRFLYEFARDTFRGEGLIIDAGIFMGASTAALATGLRDRSPPYVGRPIQSFDLATCDQSTAETMAYHFPQEEWQQGKSFAHVLTRALSPYEDLVEFAVGDIRETLVNLNEPVELAFLDCSKLPSVNAHLTRVIFPRLIPGHSVVVQQDFFHEWLPWIHVTMGYLAPYFRFIGSAGPSAFFRCEKAIPEHVAAIDTWNDPPRPGLQMFDAGVPSGLSETEAYLADLARVSAVRWFEGVDASVQYANRLTKPSGETPWTLPEASFVADVMKGRGLDWAHAS
ncbi:class I SAM-dependent methyltransferase [Enterovirga sp. CN4-39]|uniref:class I SAM-dependent methyltransferase n=1 Tax=Enterovirga sp. CN4-39 TaxID=3400910 RepID=UPI003C0A7D75